MWAHYAQRHEGLCLEFAIDQDKIQRTGDALVDVKYTSHRTQQDTIPPDLEAAMPIGQLQNLCATKFSHWRYEREVRLLVDLHDHALGEELGVDLELVLRVSCKRSISMDL